MDTNYIIVGVSFIDEVIFDVEDTIEEVEE